jgi:hypothetical protein
MHPGLPILWTDKQRLRGPGGPVSIGVLDRLPGLGVRRLRKRKPRTALPRRAGASRDAGRARSARVVPARAHCAGNLLAAHDAAAVDDAREAGNEGDAGRTGPEPRRPLGFRPAGARLPRATAVPTATVPPGGPDLTTIGAPVATLLAGVQEGATRARARPARAHLDR